jgi:hypothetical protein
MANWRDFTLDFVQAVFFLQGHDYTPSQAVSRILKSSAGRFDGDMQVLPLPAEVPAEIPRVLLQSADSCWRLSMAPARIDSFWNRRAGRETLTLRDAVHECAILPLGYIGETGAHVARLALVLQRWCPDAIPSQTLIRHFCKEWTQEQPFRRSESFEIHNHKVYSPGTGGIDYRINSWVRCKSGRLLADNSPLIIVEQDLNTLTGEEPPSRFDITRAEAFFRTIVGEADEIFNRYFPD